MDLIQPEHADAELITILQKPFSERMPFILESHTPEKIIRQLPQEELLFLYYQSQEEYHPTILDLADDKQLLFLSDFIYWKQDHIVVSSFIQWIEHLTECNPQKLYAWLSAADIETMIAAFKKYTHVVKAPPAEYLDEWLHETLGDYPYFSLDGYYYILVNLTDALDLTRKTFSLMYEENKDLYIQLMEGILSEDTVELEEDAYHKPQERLAEIGFPEKEEALRIYTPLTEEEAREHKKHAPGIQHLSYEQIPHYPMLWSAEKLFIDRVFTCLMNEPADLREQLQQELIALSNKIIICHNTPLTDSQAIMHHIEQARYYINIALESLSEGKETKAAHLMKEQWLEHLFRTGFQKIIDARNSIEKHIRLYYNDSWSSFISFWNPPYENILKGLLRQYPVYADQKATGQQTDLRDFHCLNDITETTRRFDELIAVIMLFNASQIDWQSALQKNQIKADTLVMTFIINSLIFNQEDISPLSQRKLTELYHKQTLLFHDTVVFDFIEKKTDTTCHAPLTAFLSPILSAYKETCAQLPLEQFLDGSGLHDHLLIDFYLEPNK